MSDAKLLAHPQARRYLIGQSLSLLGDSAMWLACGIWVRTLTGSNAAAGLTFMFFVLPALLAPVAGLIVDRVRRRPLLVGANVAGAVVLAPLLLVNDRQDIWIIYSVMFLYGMLNVLIAPAQSALLAVLLPSELLGKANAALRTVQEGLRILAPLVGAGLFALVGGRAVVLMDMATFLAAAAFVASLSLTEPRRTKASRPAPAAEGGRQKSGGLAEIGAGFSFVAGHVALRRVIIAATLAALVIGFGESAGYAVVTDGLGRPPTFIGVLQSAQGVGAIAGGLTAALVMRRIGELRLTVVGLVLFAVGTALMGTGMLPIVLAGRVSAGVGFPWAIIAILTLLQRLAPADLQGRVFAAFQVSTSVPQAISIAIGAGLIAVLDYRIVLGIEASVILVAAMILSAARAGSAVAAQPRAEDEPVGGGSAERLEMSTSTDSVS
jgi:MFS family permease